MHPYSSTSSQRPWLLFTFVLFLFAQKILAQGLTTSGVEGFVYNSENAPVASATVVALHEPSGSRTTTTAQDNGRYVITGLRVGGPYTITAQTGDTVLATEKGVYLVVGEVASVNLGGTIKVLEEMVVTGDEATAFDGDSAGSGTYLSKDDISRRPSARRNIQDLATLDSRVNLQRGSSDQQMTVQGKNFRYNSLLVDGIRMNDGFGLNDSGFSTRGTSPVAMDALESLSVELTPYDVRRAGFTGALLNAVTKSGTNELSGSFYALYSDANMRGKNPVSGLEDDYNSTTWGGTLGGPLIKNKLFFFASFQETKTIYSATSPTSLPTATDLAAIIAKAQSYGYEPGTIGGSNLKFNSKQWLAKIDWNINDNQKFNLTYQNNRVIEPRAPENSSRTVSLSNYWYDDVALSESVIGRLNSTWTPNLSSDIQFGITDYTGTPANKGEPFPRVAITNLTFQDGRTGSVVLGTENSRQMNALETKTYNGSAVFDYTHEAHTVSFGADGEQVDSYNAFNQNVYGNYTFSGLSRWTSGTATGYTVRFPPGYSFSSPSTTSLDMYPVANWKYTMTGLFLQDKWQPNSDLTLVGGFRFDYPFMDSPEYSQGVFNAFGRRTDASMDGNELVSPRFAFNYKLPIEQEIKVRGGIGLFQGRSPAVWLSNNFSNAGTASLASPVYTLPSSGTIAFNPDPYNQLAPSGTAPTPDINLMSEEFRMPSDWKSNIGVDHKLPFWDLVASVEFGASWAENAIFYQHLNLAQTSTTPDGRERYRGRLTTSGQSADVSGRRRVSGYNDVLFVTNTSKGESWDGTVKLERPFKNNWSSSIAYTYTDAEDVSPVTSSTASSNYNTRAVYNPNEETMSTSSYEVKHRIVVTGSYKFDQISKRFPTTLSAAWTSRIGRPYSYTYLGDANGDGYQGNDLFYVPNFNEDGTLNDSKVRFGNANPTGAAAATSSPNYSGNVTSSGQVGGFVTNLTAAEQAAQFYAFLKNTGLDKYMGQVAPRNSFNSPWVHTLDITLTQEVPLYKKVKTELFLNLFNVGNMLNSDWGKLEEIDFPLRRSAAAVGIDSTVSGGQYVYAFDPNSTTATLPSDELVDQTLSRWSVQIGFKVSF